MRKRHKICITVFILFVIILGVTGVISAFSGDDEGVSEMFLSSGSMYYTNYKDTLYRFDNASGKGEIVSKLNIRDGSRVFENKGYIYYGNGSAIFRRSLGLGDTEKLIVGKNIDINLIVGNRLIYSVAYKDANNRSYSQFEYRTYNLLNGKDEVLFKRSEDMWHFFDGQEDTVIADGALGDDPGLYIIDLGTETRKKLLDVRVSNGYLANGKFYYNSQPLNSLQSIDLDSNNCEVIPLPGSDKGNRVIRPITGSGDFLYVAIHFDGEYHLIRMNITSLDTMILAKGFGSVWRLCTDGKKLYAYETNSPSDKKGNITVIPLE